MKNLILFLAISFLVGACATRQKVLDTGAVSMTYPSVPEGQKLQQTGPVKGSFCADMGQKGSFGLIDEAVKQTQTASGVDFIVNATFWQEGACMTLEGTGAKLTKAK